jgi:HEPN domain-containing protein
MLTKTDLEKLAVLRLEDAIFLQHAGRCSSAYYLAGYSLELAMKACIAKLVQPNTIPDKAFINAIYTHRLESLLGVAGLKTAFDAEIKTNPVLAAHWAIANNWSEESRYAFWDPFAAGSLLQSIADPTNGIFQWVKRHW